MQRVQQRPSRLRGKLRRASVAVAVIVIVAVIAGLALSPTAPLLGYAWLRPESAAVECRQTEGQKSERTSGQARPTSGPPVAHFAGSVSWDFICMAPSLALLKSTPVAKPSDKE